MGHNMLSPCPGEAPTHIHGLTGPLLSPRNGAKPGAVAMVAGPSRSSDQRLSCKCLVIYVNSESSVSSRRDLSEPVITPLLT